MLLFGIIFYLISPGLYKWISKIIDKMEKSIQRLSAQELIFGSLGTLIGLIIAAFIGAPFSGIFSGIHPAIGPIIFVLLELIAAIIGAEIFIKKKDDISSTLFIFKKNYQLINQEIITHKDKIKILDSITNSKINFWNKEYINKNYDNYSIDDPYWCVSSS